MSSSAVARAHHWLAVEALDAEARDPAALHGLGERLERRHQPLGVGLAQRQQAPAAALDVEHGLGVECDHVGARHAGGPPRLLLRRFASRPAQGCPERVGGVRGREHLRARRLVGAHGPQPLDGGRQRELGAAQALDEIAAPRRAERLQVGQLAVESGEPARDPLGQNSLAGDDAVALQQHLGDRAHPRSVRRSVREQRRGERPAPLHLRRRRPPAPGEAPAGLACALGKRQPRGAKRGEGVVRDLPRPGEVPERLLELDRLHIAHVGKQIGPEGGSGGEALTKRIVQRAVGTLRRGARPPRRCGPPGGGPSQRASSRK